MDKGCFFHVGINKLSDISAEYECLAHGLISSPYLNKFFINSKIDLMKFMNF